MTMKSNPITLDSYAFVEKSLSTMYSVRIKEGEYSGIIVTYGKVSLKESDDRKTATLSFQFKIDEAPAPHNEGELEKSEKFNNYLGDILSHIIQSAFDSGKYKVGTPKDDRKLTNNDSAEISE